MRLRRANGVPFVVGHRGAGKVAPDNTLEALEAAVAAGADLVEFDVGDGLILGHSARERAERPLSLAGALAFLAVHEIGVYVDLKVVGAEAEIADEIRRHGLAGRTAVSSTSARSLRRLAELAPELSRVLGYPRDRVGAARVSWPRPLTSSAASAARALMPRRVPRLVETARADVLSLHHALVSPAVVRAAHARDSAVFAWPVGDPGLVERLAVAGVDGVISGDPEMVLRVLATLKTL